MRHKRLSGLLALLMCGVLMAGCTGTAAIDDYAVNEGYELKGSSFGTGSKSGSDKSTSGIPKDKIKVGVVHLSDPAEG
ncbi:MAG: BMP family ABC transporter substrate-binding protein, partial [[Bacteroides] pectinophilus]|nr:BMP family ABC transporter substrate-binding protein [[Bacteroides] pectinophilus]